MISVSQVRAKRAAFHSVIDRAVHMQSGCDDPLSGQLEGAVLQGAVGATATAEVCFTKEHNSLARARSITGWLSSRATSIRPKKTGSQLEEDED